MGFGGGGGYVWSGGYRGDGFYCLLGWVIFVGEMCVWFGFGWGVKFDEDLVGWGGWCWGCGG